jgi:hypothetical protein
MSKNAGPCHGRAYHTLRVVLRDTIVKQSESRTDDGACVVERAPRNAHPRRYAKALGGVETRHRQRVLKQASPDTEPVGQGRGVVMRAGIRLVRNRGPFADLMV